MNVLVTGSEGFIGKNLIPFLRNKVNLVFKYDIINGYKKPSELNIHLYDWVIHLGGISSTTEQDIQKLMNHNLIWSIELFEECKKHSVNFQWASSASVYGNRRFETKAFNEYDELNPVNHYAMSKYLFEQYLNKQDMNIICQIFRYFNVYGPHEEHKGKQASPYEQFKQQAIQTGVIKIFQGSESIYRDFVPIEVVLSAHWKMLNKKESGIWNVGTGKPKSFLDVAKEIGNIYNAEIEVIPFPENLKSHYQYYTCADVTKLNK